MSIRVGPATLPITEWPFPLSVLVLAYMFAPLLTVWYVSPVTPTGPALASKSIVEACKPAILVTVGWVLLYTTMLGTQACQTVMALFKVIGPSSVTQPQYTNVPSRVMANTHEQSPIFLTTFWLYFLFVDAATGAAFGQLYLISRAIYIIAYTAPGEFSVLVEFGTQPGYSVNGNLCVGLLINAAGYGDYASMLATSCASTVVRSYFVMSFAIFPGLPFAPIVATIHWFGHKAWERRQKAKSN